MEPDQKNKLMQELSLLLMYLSSWEEKDITGAVVYRAWKGYDFSILDQLQKNGLIDFSYKAKSLYLSDEGVLKAKLLIEKFVTV